MKERIYNILKERGYSDHSAKLMLADLIDLSDPLKRMLQIWLSNEKDQPDFKWDEYSLHQLQKERGMKYPAALLTMDWLIKEPEKAKKSLTKGRK